VAEFVKPEASQKSKADAGIEVSAVTKAGAVYRKDTVPGKIELPENS
jgi:hypothetical protein